MPSPGPENPSSKKFSDWPRKIIHVDMDAFYASVEQRDRPELKGKPVIVGGDPYGRGVVSTASYEARKFGIHSAMPSAQARRLCPQGVFLKPDFRRYEEASRIIMGILRRYTVLVEPVSLDEAYLDVTQNTLSIPDPVMIATLIKQNIFAATRLTASAGVAVNCFLAKVASDMRKPDGLTVVRPEEVEDFLENLPVRKVPGVGPVTEKALHALDIRTCGELRAKKKAFLYSEFGKMGIHLYELARGIDTSEVTPERETKQYSSEETFDKDTKDMFFLRERLKRQARAVFSGLRGEGKMGRTVVLKLKYHDFEQITRSRTLENFPKDAGELYETARELLEKKTQASRRPVRLIGVGISNLVPTDAPRSTESQPDLFEFADK